MIYCLKYEHWHLNDVKVLAWSVIFLLLYFSTQWQRKYNIVMLWCDGGKTHNQLERITSNDRPFATDYSLATIYID